MKTRCNGFRRRGGKFGNRISRKGGFTLVELLAGVAVIVILAAIALPSWFAFVETWTLNSAQDGVYQQMRLAQTRAERTAVMWQTSFRTLANGTVQMAAHPTNLPPDQAAWENLDARVRLLSDETTLDLNGGIFRVQFNHRGNVNGQLGRITLVVGGQNKRCVIVSTLLGAIRKGHNRPSDGNQCN